jgi:hypothetical protein
VNPELTFDVVVFALSLTSPTDSFTDELLGGGGTACGVTAAPEGDDEEVVGDELMICCVRWAVVRLVFACVNAGSVLTAAEYAWTA